MTQEDKELLFKDLCARLPYGVMCHYETEVLTGEVFRSNGLLQSIGGVGKSFIINGQLRQISETKPYLRPMSSMTDGERNEWFKYSHVEYDCEFKPQPTLDLDNCHLSVDWLNAHHFDYRGLIEKGLALEAPEGMYK